MPKFIHQRHKPPAALDRPRELVLACAPLRSNVNLSHIVRLAGCAGIDRVIACGAARLIDKIARDGADAVRLEVHRTLLPVLRELAAAGYELVGLEQATSAQSLFEIRFPRRLVLVIGNERTGLADDVLALVQQVVEIPVFGRPHSYNVATSAAMAVYEYCRQFPRG